MVKKKLKNIIFQKELKVPTEHIQKAYAALRNIATTQRQANLAGQGGSLAQFITIYSNLYQFIAIYSNLYQISSNYIKFE